MPLERFRAYLRALSHPTTEMFLADEEPSQVQTDPNNMPVPNQILDASIPKAAITKMQNQLVPAPTTPASYRPGSSPMTDRWAAQSKAMQEINKQKRGRVTSGLTEQR